MSRGISRYPRYPARDVDAWSHIEDEGTHGAMVWLYPESGLLQGAEGYLRSTLDRFTPERGDPKIMAAIQDALTRWDDRETPEATA